MAYVVTTDEFARWYADLEAHEAESVTHCVGLLAAMGVGLGHPYSSQIKGSRYPLRELRIQASGRPLRVFYAFDPTRQAVLLLGGDKTADNRFYKVHLPKAESLWEAYLAELKKRGST